MRQKFQKVLSIPKDYTSKGSVFTPQPVLFIHSFRFNYFTFFVHYHLKKSSQEITTEDFMFSTKNMSNFMGLPLKRVLRQVEQRFQDLINKLRFRDEMVNLPLITLK